MSDINQEVKAIPEDMVVSFRNIGGSVIRDNDQYVLRDNSFLKNLTLSHTDLKPGQSTNGHSHEGLEEVYIFLEGLGTMTVGDHENIQVFPGVVVNIPAGAFHRVFNQSVRDRNLKFIAIFQKYDR